MGQRTALAGQLCKEGASEWVNADLSEAAVWEALEVLVNELHGVRTFRFNDPSALDKDKICRL
jgi:hypothetical protein